MVFFIFLTIGTVNDVIIQKIMRQKVKGKCRGGGDIPSDPEPKENHEII